MTGEGVQQGRRPGVAWGTCPGRRRRRWRSGAALTAVVVLHAGLLASPASAAPGDLDRSFNNGTVAWDYGSTGADGAYSVLAQPDGKPVIGGVTTDAAPIGHDFTLTRLNTDGSLDATFGTGGMVRTNGPGEAYADEEGGVWDMALQPDGKIVAVGRTNNSAESPDVYSFAVARYNTDGSLDTSFDSDGWVTTIVDPDSFCGSRAEGVAIAADGKIVVAGSGYDCLDRLIVARYNADGGLDTSFGTGGVLVNVGPEYHLGKEVTLTPDGDIVVVGTMAGAFGGDFGLMRLNAEDGSLDTAFGSGGVVTLDFGGDEWALRVGVQPGDGKLVVAGMADQDSPTAAVPLARLDPDDGSLDASFGTGGKVVLPRTAVEASTAHFGFRLGLDLGADGRTVVAGRVSGPLGSDFGVVRLLPDGSFDNTWGGDGSVRTDLTGGNERAGGVAVAPDGNVVVAGEVPIVHRSHGAARYKGGLRASMCSGMNITNTISGTAGDDTLVGTPGNDLIVGLLGNDTISGGGGNDCIYGGTGNDTLLGEAGNDRLYGQAGDDTLNGGAGSDSLIAGTGIDATNAGLGNDTIRIAAGDVPASGTENILGKAGTDTLKLGAGLGPADVAGGTPPAPFTVSDPSGGTYSVSGVEQTADTT